MKVFDFRLRPPLRSFLQCDFFNYTSSPFAWFGSAYPYLGVKEMVDSYMKLPYKDSVREKVMYRNARRLLGMAS